jgi:hypothetical protein
MFVSSRKLAAAKTHSLPAMEAKAIEWFRRSYGYRWYRCDDGLGWRRTEWTRKGLFGDSARSALEEVRRIRAEMARRATTTPVPTPNHGRGTFCPLRPTTLAERRIA